jgi:hypothetical protein
MLETWEELRSALRRQMRIFSPSTRASARPAGETKPKNAAVGEEQRRREDAERKAIVSVQGRDLSSEDEIADAPPEPGKEKAA